MGFRKVAGICMYKDVCMQDEEPKESEESKESDETEPEPEPVEPEKPENACAGKNRGQCRELGDACSWDGPAKKCLSAEDVKETLGVWFGFDGSFKTYKKICSDPELCGSCGGKSKKKKNKHICQLKEKKIKCPKLKDSTICSVVPGCSFGKKGCKGKAVFTN